MANKKTSWKDVVVELKSVGGLANVAKLGASRAVLREAMRQLEARGEDYSDLEAWCRQTHGFGLNNRNSRLPRAGDERTYKAQGYPANESAFGKVPLDTLGIRKGGRFKVSFAEDQIILTRP